MDYKMIRHNMKCCRRDFPRELKYFMKYAIGAKLHKGKYKSKKVIMLRLDMIGDCTMFTGAASSIREFYKDREMTMVCLNTTKPVFERLGIFDKIITVDFKPHEIDYEKLDAVIKELRKEEYDILLQPQTSKHPVADILAAAIKCNTRIAIETKIGNSKYYWVGMTNSLYDRFIPYPRGNVSEFDYYGAFVRGLGLPDYKTVCPSLTYDEQNFVEGDYFVLYPGGSFSQKFWEADRFARLADHIYSRTGMTCVILGVASEQWVSDKLKSYMKPLTSISTIDLTGRTSISDVIDIIGNAKLVVSNDTSGVHIACATKTPSLAFAGGWHFDRFLPYHIEDVKEDDCLPVVAHTDMPCYFCDWNWDTIGERNTVCLERMKVGATSQCIDLITYEQVEILADQLIAQYNLDKRSF